MFESQVLIKIMRKI